MGNVSAAALLVALGLFVACGGDDAGGGGATPDGGGTSGGTSGGSSGSSGGASGSSGGGDAGADAAPYVPPAPCTRGAEAKTAPASLYDALVSDLAGLAASAKPARVDTFLADVAAQGGAPLEDPATGRAVFVVRGGTAWSVIGSFSGFDKTKGLAMSALPDTDLWVVETTALTTSATYKLLSGNEDSGIVPDPLAKNVAWDGILRGAMGSFNRGQFNAIARPAKLPATQGRLTVHGAVHATQLANDRKVFVYFPPKYDDGSCSKLPTIVFQDGNETLTQGDYATLADGVYAADPSLSAVLVFAQLADGSANALQQRTDEYTFGTDTAKGTEYVDFLANDLWPAVSTTYRLCSRKEARGLSGVSLGGLVTTFAAFEKPDAWGWVGAQSASYWWAASALVTRVTNTTPKIDVRFFIDSSDQASDNYYDVENMATALAGKGYTYDRVKTVVADPMAHDFKYFKLRVPQLLTDFRSGISACD